MQFLESIYNGGDGVGGGNVTTRLANIMPVVGIKVVDANGWIGGDYMNPYYPNNQYYNNFAIVIDGANFENDGLGKVTFVDTSSTIGGRVYPTVTINGVTWMAENLDYKFSGCGIGGSGNPNTPNAWYYNNDEATYGIDGVRKCGLLYNWYAAKLLNDNRADLIPGWHVPTKDEWTALADAVGGNAVAGTRLKASNVGWAPSWGGSDDYGFGVLPSGDYYNNFNYIVSRAYFWTVTESGSRAYFTRFDTDDAMVQNPDYKEAGFSIRLVKDI